MSYWAAVTRLPRRHRRPWLSGATPAAPWLNIKPPFQGIERVVLAVRLNPCAGAKTRGVVGEGAEERPPNALDR